MLGVTKKMNFEEENIHNNKKTDKTYISRPITTKDYKPDGKGGVVEEIKNIRIVSKVIDSKEQYTFAKVKNEVVLRKTTGGRQELIAKLVEDSKDVFVLTFQKFTSETGMPHKASFSFVGNEIGQLFNFLKTLNLIPFDKPTSSNIQDTELARLLPSKENIKKFVLDNEEIISEVLKNELTKEDIVTLGYRKKQLEIFDKMLNDIEYFDQLKIQYKITRDEELWQKYFEKNTWIFGYGLNYVFNSALEGKKLEQVISGYDFNNSGKRSDALLKTRGMVESLFFGEIKTHKTDLIKQKKSPYRPESWQISDELTGAIAQIQRTVHKSVNNIKTKTEIKNKQGTLTGETLFLYSPKSYLIIGNLSEFKEESGINEDKYSSFEMFRQGLSKIDIITFDELYQRAKFIIKNSE